MLFILLVGDFILFCQMRDVKFSSLTLFVIFFLFFFYSASLASGPCEHELFISTSLTH